MKLDGEADIDLPGTVKLRKLRAFRDTVRSWLDDGVEVEVGPKGDDGMLNPVVKMPPDVEEAFEEVEDL